MALIFVSAATGNDGDSGLTEALAKLTLNGALAIAAEDDVIAVKADGTYTPNDNMTQHGVVVVGYDTTPPTEAAWWTGDCSRGGGQYNSTWAVLDGGGSNEIFLGNAKKGTRFINCKFQNTGIAAMPIDFSTGYSASDEGLFCDNCWFDGGLYIDLKWMEMPQFIDCKFTGTWSQQVGTGVWKPILYRVNGGVINSCYFNPTVADGCINGLTYQDSGTIYIPTVVVNSIFTSAATANALRTGLVKIAYGGMVFNNTFYQPSGATYAGEKGVGILGIGAMLNIETNVVLTGEFLQTAGSNIFKSDETSNPANTMWTGSQIKPFIGYNCYHGGAVLDFTPRQGDIITDPQLVDPANGDFRLKITSPCINTGMPSIYGQGLAVKGSMGAAQPEVFIVKNNWNSSFKGKG